MGLALARVHVRTQRMHKRGGQPMRYTLRTYDKENDKSMAHSDHSSIWKALAAAKELNSTWTENDRILVYDNLTHQIWMYDRKGY